MSNEDKALMDLIDAYAEARHISGCHTYNAKTAEARAKVVASLAASAGSEPVAWCQPDDSNAGEAFSWPGTDKRPHHTTPLYTHPSPPEGMVGGWEDIATAPKDGTKIWGYCPKFGQRETYMNKYGDGSPGYAEWKAGRGPLECGWEWSEPKNNWSHKWSPTHWRELPPAPPIAAGGGKEA